MSHQGFIQDSGLGGGVRGQIELPKILGRGQRNTEPYRCTDTGGYYTVGNNAMSIQFKGIKGLVTVVLRNFSEIIYHESLFFIHFPINSTFQ